MPSPKAHHHNHNRRGSIGGEKNRKGRLAEKAQSFHAGMMSGGGIGGGDTLLRRPRTVPDLLSGGEVVARASSDVEVRPPKLTKLLLNVTIQRCSGAVQLLMSPEAMVEDLIAAALRQYFKEGRRPILQATDAAGFDLHYSQFSLESLPREEKLMALGSRNFFLCPKKSDAETPSSSRCSKQAGKAAKIGVEVKPGEPLKVKLQPDRIIHVVQAALGEVENGKGPKNFPIYVKVDEKKYVIGSLSSEDRPQSVIDLVFEREFELSHDWKNGNVYFAGCITKDPCMDYKGNNVDEDEVVPALQNGKLNPKMKTGKLKEESDEDDDNSDSEEDSSDFSAGISSEDNLDDSDDSDADAYELKPKLDQPGKKRTFESVAKTHDPAKKGKLATPERRGDKNDYLAKSKKQKSK